MSTHRASVLKVLTGAWLGTVLIGDPGPASADQPIATGPGKDVVQINGLDFGDDGSMVITYVTDETGPRRCAFKMSTDAGATWGPRQFVPFLPTYNDQNRASVARDALGNRYVGCKQIRTGARAISSSKIFAGLTTAQSPRQVVDANATIGAFQDPIFLADWSPQSSFANRVYVLSEVKFVGVPDTGGIRNFRSADGGQSWSSPSTLVSPTDQFNENPFGIVDEFGRVIDVWTDYFLTDKIMISWSDDGGVTFNPPLKVADFTRHPDLRISKHARAYPCPSDVGGGSIYWGDYSDGRGQIKRSTTPDWSIYTTPIVVVPSSASQFLPYVACNRDRRIDVTWYQIVGAGNLANLHLTSSEDDGATWSAPIRFNDISLDLGAVSDASGGSMFPPSLARIGAFAPLEQSRALIPGTQVFPVWTGLASLGNSDVLTAGPASGILLVAAVLPASRSVVVGQPSTLFVTIINAGGATATQVGMQLLTGVPATFSYQTTDANNLPTGTPNTPVDIAPGDSQTFLIVLTANAPFPPSDILLSFAGTNTAPVRTLVGVNTFLQSASATPVADLIMLTANAGTPGIVDVSPVSNTGAFAMATVNVGAGDTLTISAGTGDVSLPLTILVCQTVGGACLANPALSVMTAIGPNETPTYSFFLLATGFIPFDPAVNRIVISAVDSGGVVRGRTNLAVRTQ